MTIKIWCASPAAKRTWSSSGGTSGGRCFWRKRNAMKKCAALRRRGERCVITAHNPDYLSPESWPTSGPPRNKRR